MTVSQGTQKATDVFPVIAIWTDQDTHAPSFNYSLLNPNYPPASNMPRDYAGLLEKWTDSTKIPQANKLLAMFIPDSALTNNWQAVQAWDRFMHVGTLTDGTNQMVARLADAVETIVAKSAAVRLTN